MTSSNKERPHRNEWSLFYILFILIGLPYSFAYSIIDRVPLLSPSQKQITQSQTSAIILFRRGPAVLPYVSQSARYRSISNPFSFAYCSPREYHDFILSSYVWQAEINVCFCYLIICKPPATRNDNPHNWQFFMKYPKLSRIDFYRGIAINRFFFYELATATTLPIIFFITTKPQYLTM